MSSRAGSLALPPAWGLRGAVGPAVRRGFLVAIPVGLALLTELELDDELAGALGTAALIAGFIAFDAPARVRVRWQVCCAPLIGVCGAIGVLSSVGWLLAVAAMLLIASAAAYLISVSMRMTIAGLSATLALLLAQGLLLDPSEAWKALVLGTLGGLLQALTAGLAWAFADRDREPFAWAAAARETIAALGANLSLDAKPMRHAIRFGVAMALGVAVYRLSGFDDHGYWIPLTILFVLKPDADQTIERIAMRAAGTVIGLILATLLAEVLTNDVVPCTIVLTIAAALSFALLAIEYALFTTAITVFVVLLTDTLGAEPLDAAGARGLGTAIGIVIAALAFHVFRDVRRTEERGVG